MIEPYPALDSCHLLNDKWVLYHHFPSEKDWTISGYTIVEDNIDSVEKTISLVNALPENMIKYSMLFFMRKHISPLWEDKHNCLGGCFSFKVFNKQVEQVWKDMMYMICGEKLMTNIEDSCIISGITISPKKNFCIIKIWITDMNHQDSQMINYVENLTNHGSVFKKHS